MKCLIVYGKELKDRQYFCFQKVVKVNFNETSVEVQYLADDYCRENKLFPVSELLDVEVV